MRQYIRTNRGALWLAARSRGRARMEWNERLDRMDDYLKELPQRQRESTSDT